MNTAEIKALLHEKIEQGDERLIKIIFAVVQEYNVDDHDDRRKSLIEEERAKYLRGEGKSYTWDEIKTIQKKRTK